MHAARINNVSVTGATDMLKKPAGAVGSSYEVRLGVWSLSSRSRPGKA